MIGSVSAEILYFNGLEADDDVENFDFGDWRAYEPYGGSVVRVPSGGGTLGVPSASGDFHLEAIRDSYGIMFWQYMDAVNNNLHYEYEGLDLTQSVDIFIDANWAAPSVPEDPALVVRHRPGGRDAEGIAIGYGYAEPTQYFQLMVDGTGEIDVRINEGTPFATITQSGWYTFESRFNKGNTDSDPVNIRSAIYDASDIQVGSFVNSTAGVSSQLGGRGYIYARPMQENFAGGVIAADNALATIMIFSTDINDDDIVDDKDLNILLSDFIPSGGETYQQGQLAALLADFGSPGTQAGTLAVPEPATMTMAWLALIGLMAIAWRGRQ